MSSKAANTPTPKRPAKAASKPARKTVASLSTDLKALETRLKGADTKNRNALKTLETVVTELQSAAQSSSLSQKAELNRGLTALEVRMETYLSRASALARAGVREELAAVTAPNADIETLNQAVQAAHARLDHLDTAQRESVARLNRHIADIATSVEQRLSGEANARRAVTAALDTKIDNIRKTFDTRVDQVELDTAGALESIGERIADFAAVLENRSHASDAQTAERLADLAQETQSDFNHAQTDMTTRLEALETIAANWSPVEPVFPANMADPRVDTMAETVISLQDELSRMHAHLAMIQEGGSKLTPPQMPANVVSMMSQHSLQTVAPHLMDNPYAEAARALEATTATAAPTPTQPPAEIMSPAPQANPPAADSHIPQEFDPTAFSAPMPAHIGGLETPPMGFALPDTPQAAASLAHQPPMAPIAPPMASTGAHSVPPLTHPALGAEYQQVIEPVMPAPMPVSTYADPAYAEGNEMRAERIGGETPRNSITPKLPISGRNLRVGALAAGLAVVGLIAAKTLLGGDSLDLNVGNDVPSETSAIQSASAPGPLITGPDIAQPFGDPMSSTQSTPPLGQYAETQTPALTPGGQTTLDSAVAAGNPIAQFQKGLVQLQAGQTKEGARLIRLSANRNQPAAQYRLAKLYESGTGVAKDVITARELVERAAIGGNRIAMHDLGNYYAEGTGGLDADISQALEWFTKAAERGVVDSQFNVAFLREGNAGVAADPEAALFWYYIAARQGDQGAPERISVLTAKLDAETQADIKSRSERFNPKPVDEAANGIFRDVPWGKSLTASNGVDPARTAEVIRVREVQTLLTDIGFDIGAADGAAGPKTRAAIKEFETVNGLPETGQVTDELIQRLEIAAGA